MKLENENTQKDCMPTASPVKKGDTTKGDFINTIGFKLIVITVLMLLLMLPASMIESIIKEREISCSCGSERKVGRKPGN